MLKNNIVLIGFMGCGKTTVGIELAKQNNMTFIDTDTKIELEEHMTVKEIFNHFSEKHFRQLETNQLEKLLKTTNNAIISTGGGIVIREENRLLLKKIGTVIYLKTSEQELIKRLQNDTKRPLLKQQKLDDAVTNLLTLRIPIYENLADIIINTDGKTVENITKEIKRCI